jgi:hypothetical protein
VKIEQTAGACTVSIYTDGWPRWPEFMIIANNGERHTICGSVDHLHDLRYCIDRVLAQLEAHECLKAPTGRMTR